MKYHSDLFKVSILNINFIELIFSVLFLLLCFVLLIFSGCIPDRSPPDLSSCTHIEIRYHPSNLNCFIPSSSMQETLLSPEERAYIQSIEFFTVNDLELIKAFSRDISLGSYKGRHPGIAYGYANPIEIRCYRNNKHIISFTVFGNEILTKDWRIFKYPTSLPSLELIEPPEMQPFKLRFLCGANMVALHNAGPLYKRKVSSYPRATEWCDTMIRDRTNTTYVNEEKMKDHFKCPSAGEGRSHYAINLNCEPNSPPDTVLLFEAEAGWNQHGGPELFTFDHHDPKGGCVLLNDGTVKFIRTKEEFQKLRWK